MMRKAVALLGAVLTMSLAVTTVSTAKPRSTEEPIELRVGKPIFWDGPFIEQTGLPFPIGGFVGDPELCDVDSTRCASFPLDVAEEGALLRVALDHPAPIDQFHLALYDPAGTLVAQERFENWGSELRAVEPVMGRWTAVVEFRDVNNSAFRMRALLEATPKPSRTGQDLVPNLRMAPPSQFGWTCDPRETVTDSAVNCLRFAAGPENVGDGPLFLHMKEPGVTGTMIQRVLRSDGSYFDRDAGDYEFHAYHGHYHQIGVGEWELLRVVDPKQGELVKVGSGRKQGFCTGDSVIAEWERFTQDPPRPLPLALGECTGVEDADGAVMGLSRGWADIYLTSTEGNYVEFGANTDGEYVVRLRTDVFDSILEMDESDNASYALIRVEGTTITVLERGYGEGPWDPRRVLSTDIREPLA